MRLVGGIFIVLASTLTTLVFSIPQHHTESHRRGADVSDVVYSNAQLSRRGNDVFDARLEKRRGGGGGGSSGGGSSGGGSSGAGSSGAGSSGAGGSSGAAGSRGGSGSSGGGSTGGSGSTGSRGSTSSSSSSPSYGGGRVYGGGSTSPYSSGTRSPRGVAPYLLGGAALGIFPGLWLYGAYAYPYTHSYAYRNNTRAANGTTPAQNETLPVTCLCAQYSACGCDDNDNTTYIDELLQNGTAKSDGTGLATITDVNGTRTVVINGTLENGTDDSNSSDPNAAGTSAGSSSYRQKMLEHSGYWLMLALVGLIVFA